MQEAHNTEIFCRLIKELLFLQVIVASIWFFIYKLYKHDIKHGKIIFVINVLVYFFCNIYLIRDLKNYLDLREGGISFGFEMGTLLLSIISTFLLVVEYFIIKLIIRAFVTKNPNS